MSDQPIFLRRDPGRDSTASDIAKSRGEFRRRPHVEGEVAGPDRVPTAKPADAQPGPKPPAARSSRLLH